MTQEKFDGFTYMVSRKRRQDGGLLGKEMLNGARSAIVDLHKAQRVFYKDKLKDHATLVYDQVRSHCRRWPVRNTCLWEGPLGCPEAFPIETLRGAPKR